MCVGLTSVAFTRRGKSRDTCLDIWLKSYYAELLDFLPRLANATLGISPYAISIVVIFHSGPAPQGL